MAYGAAALACKARAAALALAVVLASPAMAEETVILAFGDSLTQGYGLPEAEGFVPQLETWLMDHGAEVRLVNGGVSGDTTAGGKARIAWSLTDDVDAVIVALGGNDLLRGLPPELARGNLDAILTEISGRGLPVLLAGMRAPGNFGPEYKREFDAIYPDLAASHDALFYPYFLAGLGAGEDGAAAREFLQGDSLHPNRDGVARIVADIGPMVLDLVTRVGESR